MLNNSWLRAFASCPRDITPASIASWISLHSWHGVVSQQCLALPVQREGFLFVVEITPYLSASYKAADRFQIPVVKDNPLLTCPAPLVCSQTANVVPGVLGGSFLFSMFMTRNKKMKSCVKLRKLQEPGRGWLPPGQFVSSRGTSEVRFKKKRHPVLISTGLPGNNCYNMIQAPQSCIAPVQAQ